MRTVLFLATALIVFGCTDVAPSVQSYGIEDRTPRAIRVLEDVNAIQSGMDRARASFRAGL